MTGDVFALVVVAWVSIAFVVALVMKRGHFDFGEWLVVGLLVGPFVIPIAVMECHARRDNDDRRRQRHR